MFSGTALAAACEFFHDIALEEPSKLDLQQMAPGSHCGFSHYPSGRSGRRSPSSEGEPCLLEGALGLVLSINEFHEVSGALVTP